jgi:hypothetical protein
VKARPGCRLDIRDLPSALFISGFSTWLSGAKANLFLVF